MELVDLLENVDQMEGAPVVRFALPTLRISDRLIYQVLHCMDRLRAMDLAN